MRLRKSLDAVFLNSFSLSSLISDFLMKISQNSIVIQCICNRVKALTIICVLIITNRWKGEKRNMRLYNPDDKNENDYIELPAVREDIEKLISKKFKEEAEKIQKELNSENSDNTV